MNPFDLRGPEFLLFYSIFSVVVIAVLVLLRYLLEADRAPKIDLADPYLIAYLRGGEEELLRVSLVSLIDRGLLEVNGTSVKRADNARTGAVRRPLEKALLEKFEKPGEANWIFNDTHLQAECEAYRETLKRNRLLPDDEIERARTSRLIVAALLLAGVGGIKIFVALQRGRTNIFFLLILIIAAIAVAVKVSSPRLTARGAAMLADVQALYSGLKERAALLRPGGATIDAMMLAAVFGVGALAGHGFAYTQTLFPRPQRATGSGSSWGSSCGSSCGSSSCGSSCGGGGCGGGCGGCGG